MDSTTPDATVARPQRSGPIRNLSRIFGPIGRPMAGHRLFPFWAVLHHTGRTSGTAYATPVVALRTTDGFLIPLPFGDATQWKKNLVAADQGSVTFGGREYPVRGARVVEREAIADHLPKPVRFAARRVGIRQFVAVDLES